MSLAADDLPEGKKSSRSRKSARSSAAAWRDLAAALAGARRRPLPAGFAPQLCIQHATPPRGEGWLHETKWDGYRMLADLDGGRVQLRSRKNLNWTEKLPEIAAAIEALPVASARIDGELVALDAQGHSDFSELQHALKSGATRALRYMIFDLPALEGVDLTRSPLIERKALLEKLLSASRRKHTLVSSTHIVGHGDKVFAAAGKAGLEGIVSKAVDSHYVQARDSTWIKVKHANTDEFVVVGYSAPKGSRTGFGALLLATVERGALRYVGRVGTGFDDETLRSLSRRLSSLARKDPVVDLPAHIPRSERLAQWVDPVLVAEIEFRGWAKEGLLRQGSFMRLRDDKTVEDLGLKPKSRTAKRKPVRRPHSRPLKENGR